MTSWRLMLAHTQIYYLPSVQDHHGHLGVLLQPGENCLSRGFHFWLSKCKYLAQQRALAFAQMEKEFFANILKGEKRNDKSISAHQENLSFPQLHISILGEIYKIMHHFPVDYLTLFLLFHGRRISTEISLFLRLFASVMCPMQWEFSTRV